MPPAGGAIFGRPAEISLPDGKPVHITTRFGDAGASLPSNHRRRCLPGPRDQMQQT
jgi:hypothetical protein